MKWSDIKNLGSIYYKSSSVIEPIDLYKSGELLRDFSVGSIIKYAYRNRSKVGKTVSISDMKKIVHYAEMLISIEEERVSGKVL